MPKPTEKAILVVNGAEYSDWETVMVRHAMTESPFYRFRFTCSEGMPLDKNFAKMRIRPGDFCTIYLAGQLAFTGYVNTRQVYVDANRHHIELRGASTVLKMTTAAAVTKNMEYVNKTLGDMAAEQAAQVGVNFLFEGGAAPMYKIPRASIPPGTSKIEFLDTQSRKIPTGSDGFGIRFTSNVNGDFVIQLGESGENDDLVEGVNMEEMYELIFNPDMQEKLGVSNQRPMMQGDKGWGSVIASLPGFLGSIFRGGMVQSWTIMEGPAWDTQSMTSRANNEGGWLVADQITVIGTVYGWLKSDGALWKRAGITRVKSPMLIMDGSEKLYAYSITFTQDDNKGTRTAIECRNTRAFGTEAPTS